MKFNAKASNEINPSRAAVHFTAKLFHTHSVFHKARKGFFSAKGCVNGVLSEVRERKSTPTCF